MVDIDSSVQFESVLPQRFPQSWAEPGAVILFVMLIMVMLHQCLKTYLKYRRESELKDRGVGSKNPGFNPV